MSTKERGVHDEQFNLFRPCPTRPAWTDLPEGVRSEVVGLVMQLFLQDTAARGGADAGAGAGDE